MIKTETTIVSYQGDGAQKTFQFPFKLDEAKDISVWIAYNGTLTEVSNYSITPADGGYPTVGGTITYPADSSANLNRGRTIYIMRDMPYLQLTEYARNNSLSLEDLEKSFDSTVEMVQQLAEKNSRTVSVSIMHKGITLPEPDEGNALIWKGERLVNYDVDNFMQKLNQISTQVNMDADNTYNTLKQSKTLMDQWRKEAKSTQDALIQFYNTKTSEFEASQDDYNSQLQETFDGYKSLLDTETETHKKELKDDADNLETGLEAKFNIFDNLLSDLYTKAITDTRDEKDAATKAITKAQEDAVASAQSSIRDETTQATETVKAAEKEAQTNITGAATTAQNNLDNTVADAKTSINEMVGEVTKVADDVTNKAEPQIKEWYDDIQKAYPNTITAASQAKQAAGAASTSATNAASSASDAASSADAAKKQATDAINAAYDSIKAKAFLEERLKDIRLVLDENDYGMNAIVTTGG